MFRHKLFPFNLGSKWWVLDVFLRSDWDMDLCRKINCITCDADAKAANPSAIRNVVERGKSWLLREYHPLHQNTSKMGGSRGIMLTFLFGVHWGLASSCVTKHSPSTTVSSIKPHITSKYRGLMESTAGFFFYLHFFLSCFFM